jgi:hypothetical protein
MIIGQDPTPIYIGGKLILWHCVFLGYAEELSASESKSTVIALCFVDELS